MVSREQQAHKEIQVLRVAKDLLVPREQLESKELKVPKDLLAPRVILDQLDQQEQLDLREPKVQLVHRVLKEPRVRKDLQDQLEPKGAQGPTGAQGAQGAQGPQGVTGPTGPTGPITIVDFVDNGDDTVTVVNIDSTGPTLVTPPELDGKYIWCQTGASGTWVQEQDYDAKNILGTTGATDPNVDVTNPTEGDQWVNSDTGESFIYQNGVWQLIPCCAKDVIDNPDDTVTVINNNGTTGPTLIEVPVGTGCFVWCQNGGTGEWKERKINFSVCGLDFEFTDATGTIDIEMKPLIIQYTGGNLPGPSGATALNEITTEGTGGCVFNPVYAQDPQTCLTHVFICGVGWTPLGENCPVTCDFKDSGLTGPLDEENDGLLVAINSSNPTSSTVPHILTSLSLEDENFTDLIGPDTFSGTFTNISNGDVTIQLNGDGSGQTIADFNIDSADFLEKALRAYKSRNLNHYGQYNLSGNPSPSTGTYTLGYNSPIPVNKGIFLIVTERGGNNAYNLEAFEGATSVGTLTVGTADYTDSGFANSGSQNIEYAVFPLDDLAAPGSLITSITQTFTNNSDGPDGKIFLWGDVCIIP